MMVAKCRLSFFLVIGLIVNTIQTVNAQEERNKVHYKKGNPYGLAEDKVNWIRNTTIQQLEGSRVEGPGGISLFTPDGVGHYAALWTRDFYYMIEYAGDLISQQEKKTLIKYIINGQREDGCIPDRVNALGKPTYSPGGEKKSLADHALDNGAFMALMVCTYFDQHQDKAFFRAVEPKIHKGLNHISRSDNGLVYNDPGNPQCVYGFTDIVKKTGNLLFCSVLYYDACQQMARICRETQCGDPGDYLLRASLIRENIHLLWNESEGMFWAADKQCRQTDIWGSALAIDVGLTKRKQRKRIAKYLVQNYDQISMKGQVRHLAPNDSSWEQLFHPCPEGTYQNGAFWATPLAWIVPIVAREDKKLAQKMLESVIDDFKQNGITECINEGYQKIPNYVVSATNVYSLVR